MQDLLGKVDLQELITSFVERLIEFIPSLIAAILVVVAAYILSRAARVVLRKAFQKAGFDEVVINLLVDNVAHYAIIILGVIMALSQLGVNVAAALAGVGVVGIAIGFAAQDSVANIIAGILIFWDKPFVVGDWVETEGEYGKVTNITLRTTRIRTPQNTYIVVPNKRIIDEVLENFSKHGELRVDAVIGIAYKEDIPKAREVLLEAIRAVDGVLEDPAPDVVVSELAGSSVNLTMRAWVDSADDKRRVFFKLNEAGKIALDDAGIEIPFPHLQLFVDNVQDDVWKGLSQVAGGRSQ
ncbi:MAG: mechanosensitive ion channel [Gammaproteobacteria bacterium]|nr:mechanosensitive ion channel [Gammaproteobacteria bacterium]NND54451.1 mechanosensitive ion channel [Gammaproteobacteria bacterium]